MPDLDNRTKPADMDNQELDAAIARVARARAEAPTTTRRLVASSILDRLLDEKFSRGPQASA
jgi:hypothetical protein